MLRSHLGRLKFAFLEIAIENRFLEVRACSRINSRQDKGAKLSPEKDAEDWSCDDCWHLEPTIRRQFRNDDYPGKDNKSGTHLGDPINRHIKSVSDVDFVEEWSRIWILRPHKQNVIDTRE